MSVAKSTSEGWRAQGRCRSDRMGRRGGLWGGARGVWITALFALVSVVASGCIEEPDDPDGDDRRGRAKQLPIGQVVTDAITPPVDGVDWKLIETPSNGFLTVRIFWDTPTVDGTFTVVDKYGVTLQEIRRDRRTPSDQVIVRSEQATFFFVKVESIEGESVYSLQTSFATGNDDLDGTDEPIPELVEPIDPPEEEKEEGEGEGEKKEEGEGPALPPGADAGGGKAAPAAGVSTAPVIPAGEPADSAPKAPAVVDLVPDYTGAYDPLDAQILRVIPKARGGSEITLGVGSNNGVDKNLVGEIMMSNGERLNGGRFLVTEVYKNTAIAQTNAPANQVSAAAKVVVKIPK